MSNLLIVKTGSTMPELYAQCQDFEHWIARSMDWPLAEIQVVDVSLGETLPPYETIDGIVITGSHALVTEHQDWSEVTAAWLAIAAQQQIPTIGICYGHQLLAYALGGTVDFNPVGREVGSITVSLQSAAQDDPLFGNLPANILVNLSHRQAVLALPTDVTHLASSAMAEHQAFRYGEQVWGLQFHPEFDEQITRAYITYAKAGLSQEGQDPDAIYANVQPTPIGLEIMQRFAALLR
ncbi:glutamine amidotransferase [filamentous cyanobacterium LEGE 11480]|uniref:Glutamine amidotransferase n=1 Tax=Romeriopsis navalis LEGE 11480 TaxID=2777977 RepID=A0A928VKX1_9CYAN|nr:glutamine amidotransferase [Romeriopsis navalis]MBE9028420.1 glutamine amidotransferase [Romeriopsis navalis LEGE 11480]